MKNARTLSFPLLAAGLLVAATAPAQADGHRNMVRNPTYQQECSACHVAYPPKYLSADSWRAVMDGLPRHFGTDASLDPAEHAEILRYLEDNAGRRNTAAGGKPLLRITETRWFVHEHSEELPRDVWKHPAVKSASNCAACHTAAEKGNFSERTLRLPKGVSK